MSPEFARRAVAIGGGTGLPGVLRCLVSRGFDTTAVVTMADDGGSSGILREHLGILPPGDIRNCLVALADDPDGELARLFQHRFSSGEGLEGHAVGNLLIAALTEMHGGSFERAVDAAGEILGIRGRVLPSTLDDVTLHAIDASGGPVTGQARIAVSDGPVVGVTTRPAAPAAYPPALEALEAADVIVIGPGSLFTSIIPNFLVSGIAEAVRGSSARRVYICNVANLRGETQGMDAAEHVEALFEHGLAGAIDVAVVHEAPPATHTVPGVYHEGRPGRIEPVEARADARDRLSKAGVEVVIADLVDPASPVRHDHERLCAVLGEVL